MATSVVYATQFHNLVAGIFAAGAKVGVIPAFHGVSFQPISTADVARVLLGEALAGGAGAPERLAGGPAVLSHEGAGAGVEGMSPAARRW